MSTPRAVPPTADAKPIKWAEQLQRRNLSQVNDLKEGARTASQEAARAERRRNALPVPARVVRRGRTNAGTASTPQVEQAPGSDPSAPHNVTLVGSKTKQVSEKVNATAPTPAPVDIDDSVNVGRQPFVEIQGGMQICVEERDLHHVQEIGQDHPGENPWKERDLQHLQEIGQDDHGENPWKDQAKAVMKELDPVMRKELENESEVGASQGANSSAAHFPAPTVPNESGDVEGDNPDHNTEKDAAVEDGASAAHR